jgi:DNA primase
MINSPIEEIKNKLDIVELIGSYIKLQKAGVNYRAVCPFHTEKGPSFFVSPVRQIWHCFGSCQEGGDIFKFVMKIEGVEFGDALRILAQKAGVELKKLDPQMAIQNKQKDRLYEISELACKFFEKQLESSLSGKEVKQYLTKRGMTEESILKWRLGYSPEPWDVLFSFLVQKGYKEEEIEKTGLSLKSQKSGKWFDRFRGRIMFPIFDLNSQVVGFGGRVFKNTKRQDGTDEAKYINSPATLLYDKSKVLYGLNKASLEIRKKDACIMVEGYMDAIMAHQAGTQNLVATSGTALTINQLRTLKRYTSNLYTSFDMDLAGNSATKRGIDLAQAEGFDIKVVVLPGDKDPADLVLREPALWIEAVKKAKSIHDFYFSTVLSRFDKNSIEGKKEISKVILPVIKKIPNKIEQGAWIKNLSDQIGVKEEYILAELDKVQIQSAPYEAKEITKTPPVAIINRRSLLEERLAMLLMKNPASCQMLSKEDLKIFSLSEVRVLDYLIENKGVIGAVLPEDLSQRINYLYLKSESELNEVNAENEFKDCLMHLKMLYAKEQLNNISQEMKRAEQENNYQKVQELVQQFNQEAKFLEES